MPVQTHNSNPYFCSNTFYVGIAFNETRQYKEGRAVYVLNIRCFFLFINISGHLTVIGNSSQSNNARGVGPSVFS